MLYKEIVAEINSHIHNAINCILCPDVTCLVLDYAGICEFDVFSQILKVRATKGIITRPGWHTYTIYLGHDGQQAFIKAITPDGWRLSTRQRKFTFPLLTAFQCVQNDNYDEIAHAMKELLYKPYRPNLDKLQIIGETCKAIMQMHAEYVLARMVKPPRCNLVVKMRGEDSTEQDHDATPFWNILQAAPKRKSYLEALVS
jgi:hypothetical protein